MTTFFPNVPNVPGVPPVLRSPNFTQTLPQLLNGDIAGAVTAFLAPPWGLYQNGRVVVQADNVVSLDYKADYTLPTYPVDPNGFKSYDKVILPFETRLMFSRGGSLTDRQNFLQSILGIAQNTELYDVVMPEATFVNCNIHHVDFHRSALDGVGLLKVSMWLQQINSTASTPQFTATQTPFAAFVFQNGSQHPIPAGSTLGRIP